MSCHAVGCWLTSTKRKKILYSKINSPMKRFVQAEYQTDDWVHPMLPCVHIRRCFMILIQILLDDKAKFDDVKCLSLT